MAEFATVDEVARGRRPLTGDERLDAEALIAAASKWIRDRKPGILDDDPTAKLVVIQVVRTALDMAEHAGLRSYSSTVGGISLSGTLANPGDLLVFTDFQRELLGISTSTMPQWHFGD